MFFDELGQAADPYAILGVKADATTTELERAFRQRARECHPDKSSAATAAEQFRNLSAAIEFLLDDQKRLSFDALKQREAELKQALDQKDTRKRKWAEDLALKEAAARKKFVSTTATPRQEQNEVADTARLLRRARETNLELIRERNKASSEREPGSEEFDSKYNPKAHFGAVVQAIWSPPTEGSSEGIVIERSTLERLLAPYGRIKVLKYDAIMGTAEVLFEDVENALGAILDVLKNSNQRPFLLRLKQRASQQIPFTSHQSSPSISSSPSTSAFASIESNVLQKLRAAAAKKHQKVSK